MKFKELNEIVNNDVSFINRIEETGHPQNRLKFEYGWMRRSDLAKRNISRKKTFKRAKKKIEKEFPGAKFKFDKACKKHFELFPYNIKKIYFFVPLVAGLTLFQIGHYESIRQKSKIRLEQKLEPEGLTRQETGNYAIPLENLKKRLEKDGICDVDKYFKDSRFKIDKKIIKRRKRGRKINYFLKEWGFVTDASYEQCLDYLEKHKDHLSRIEKEFGMENELKYYIVSTKQMESNLGKKTGKRVVLNAYVSEVILNKEKGNEKRSDWFYSNLLYLLKNEDKLIKNIQTINNIFELKGSWAGAFGYCQMLAYWYRLVEDFDGDGFKDIFTHADSDYFIAKKLIKSGFRENKKKAFLRYNYNNSYVGAILHHVLELKKQDEIKAEDKSGIKLKENYLNKAK